jgi:hypothetical protein
VTTIAAGFTAPQVGKPQYAPMAQRSQTYRPFGAPRRANQYQNDNFADAPGSGGQAPVYGQPGYQNQDFQRAPMFGQGPMAYGGPYAMRAMPERQIQPQMPWQGYAAAQPVSYEQALQQMVQSRMAAPQQQAGSAVTPNQNLDAYRAAMPNPNQIVGRNWYRLPTSSREFLLGTYEAMGYSPQDVEEQIARQRPVWQAPLQGRVMA